jgi:glycosyltransferase involved in cell wall biosynthesis
MTIQNKIYEGFAMRKPVITGSSPAVSEAFGESSNIYLVERENPQSLANAIAHLKANPDLRKTLAENGYSLFLERFSTAQLGRLFKQHLLEILS